MVIQKAKDGSMFPLLRTFKLERSLAATGQYKSVLEDGEEPYHYNNAVYPLNRDKGVIQFRNWMRQLAGGRIPFKNNQQRSMLPAASNDVVFDVWNGHTRYCKYCQDALRRLKKARLASFSVATVLRVERPFGHFT